MNAKDIMTAPAITITPNTPVHEIAELLLERRISGVPVVAGGEVVGMVNEGDLLRRHEIGTDGDTPGRSIQVGVLRELERHPDGGPTGRQCTYATALCTIAA